MSVFLSFKPLPLALAMSLAAPLWLSADDAWAQPAAQAPAEAPRYRFDLPAQPLGRSLTRIADTGQLRLSVGADLVRYLQAPAIRGELTVQQAWERALAGTGLAVRQTGSGVWTLEKLAAEEVTALEAVRVVGTTGVTEGTGSYTTSEMATATGLPLSIRETPQSVTVVTRQRMEDQGSTSLREALESASGIAIQKYDSDRTEYLTRGFTVGEFQYDGVVIQNEGIYDYGLSYADMTIYDRIEIVKGANGLLQGAGNPAAAVNLVRKRPTDTFQGSLTGSAGSWRTYRTELDLSGPMNSGGTLRGRFAGSFEDAESYLDHYEKKTFTLYGILEADITDKTTLSLGADYQKNRPRGSSWTGLPMFYSDGSRTDFDVSTNPATKWSRRDTFASNVFVTLEHEFGNSWKGNLAYNHRRNGHDSVLGSAGSGYPDPVTGEGVYQYVGKFVGRLVQNTFDAKVSGPV